MCSAASVDVIVTATELPSATGVAAVCECVEWRCGRDPLHITPTHCGLHASPSCSHSSARLGAERHSRQFSPLLPHSTPTLPCSL